MLYWKCKIFPYRENDSVADDDDKDRKREGEEAVSSKVVQIVKEVWSAGVTVEVPRACYLRSEDRTAHDSAGDCYHPDKDERFLPVYPRPVQA